MNVVGRDLRQLAVALAGVVAVIGRPAVGRRLQERRRVEPLRRRIGGPRCCGTAVCGACALRNIGNASGMARLAIARLMLCRDVMVSALLDYAGGFSPFANALVHRG